MRWFLKLSLGLLAVFVLTAAILVIVVEPEDLKPTIRAFVRDHTGLDVTIEAPLRLSLLPRPELILEQVQLNDPVHPDNPVVLKADHCTFRISSWPFCAGGYAFDEIAIQGLDMDVNVLSRTVRTRTAATSSGRITLPSVLSSLACADSGAPHLNIVPIQKLRITNATLSGLPTPGSASSTVIRVASLSLDDPGQDSPAVMRLIASHDHLDLAMNATLSLSGDLESMLVDKIRARVRAKDLPFAATPVSALLTGTLLLEPGNKRVVLQTLRAELPGCDLLASSTITWDEPAWEGGLIVNARLHDALQSLGHDGRGKDHWPDRIDVKTHYSLRQDVLVFRDVHGLIDGQTIRGEGTMTGFAPPKVTFTVFGDQLDLTRYLCAGTSTGLPAWLKKSRIRGNVSINRLEMAGLNAVNVNALIRANQGILRIYPLRGEVAQGRMEANVRVDMNPATPATTLRADVNGMRIPEVTETADPRPGLLGSMDIFVDLTWRGVPWHPDPRTLSGRATVEAVNGTVVGVDLPREHPSSSLTRRILPAENILPFSALSTRLRVNKGVLTTQHLELRTQTETVTGTGSYDLVNDELRGLVTVTPDASATRTMAVRGTLNRPVINTRSNTQPASPPRTAASSPNTPPSTPPDTLP
jgi:AsmA protein